MEFFNSLISDFSRNSRLQEHLKIIVITSITTLTTVQLWYFYKNNNNKSIFQRCQDAIFTILYKIPSIKQKKDSKLDEIKNSFRNDVIKIRQNVKYVTKLPKSGQSNDVILKLLDDNLKLGHYDWLNGKVSGTVYRYETDLIHLLKEVFALTSYTNPLHPDVFPGLCKMEAEIIRIIGKLFHGSDQTCGSVTSGGTESILMACKAYRDYGRTFKGITKPEIVIPKTAHAAFDKAAEYFGLTIRHIPVDSSTTKVSTKLMEKSINSNTIMLVGSAPNFPYGTIDDIIEIAKLGTKYDVPVHVDACLGGFLTIFMEKAGYNLNPFDFRVAGVTSISTDTHKYGYSPKGSSIILYSNEKYFIRQFSVVNDWPGGCYASPSVSGSRPGAAIATCWATLLHFGQNEYILATKRIIETARYIRNKLREIKEIYIFGEPEVSVIAISSQIFNIFLLLDYLGKRGWSLNNLQFPSGFHLCVTYMHTQDGVANQFIADVTKGIEIILSQRNSETGTKLNDKIALYGAAQTISDRSLVDEILRLYLSSLYFTE